MFGILRGAGCSKQKDCDLLSKSPERSQASQGDVYTQAAYWTLMRLSQQKIIGRLYCEHHTRAFSGACGLREGSHQWSTEDSM